MQYRTNHFAKHKTNRNIVNKLYSNKKNLSDWEISSVRSLRMIYLPSTFRHVPGQNVGKHWSKGFLRNPTGQVFILELSVIQPHQQENITY